MAAIADFRRDLQLAVCPVAALSDLVEDIPLEALNVLRSPILGPVQRSHAKAHEALVEAQVEPPAHVDLERVEGASVHRQTNDLLLDVDKSCVREHLLGSMGVDPQRAFH